MKKTDLKAGVLYGHRDASPKYGRVQPALLVDTALWVWNHVLQFRPATHEVRPRKADNPYGSTVGYLVVLPRTFRAGAEVAEQIAALEIPAELTGWTLPAWDAELRERGVELALINNAHLIGDYHAAKAEERERNIREGAGQ